MPRSPTSWRSCPRSTARASSSRPPTCRSSDTLGEMRCAIAVLAMTMAFAPVASAGPTNQEKADALFKKGKTLLGQQQYKEACAAFEDSNKLDAQTGTVLNLALCYEGWGKVASAQRWYLEAEKLAAIKGDAKRGAAARQRADALTPRIPKILFTSLPE